MRQEGEPESGIISIDRIASGTIERDGTTNKDLNDRFNTVDSKIDGYHTFSLSVIQGNTLNQSKSSNIKQHASMSQMYSKLLSSNPESGRGILRVHLQKTLNQRSTKNELLQDKIDDLRSQSSQYQRKADKPIGRPGRKVQTNDKRMLIIPSTDEPILKMNAAEPPTKFRRPVIPFQITQKEEQSQHTMQRHQSSNEDLQNAISFSSIGNTQRGLTDMSRLQSVNTSKLKD